MIEAVDPPSADAVEAARKLFAGPCQFVWGAAAVGNLPPEQLSEVGFVGRSNAGKSSLINALTGRKALARVSQTPGATRQINFFNLGERLMLVDLPGYGFAKRSRSEAQSWQEMIFEYLRRRARLKQVALLLDARRGAMDSDIEVMNLLDRAGVSYGLVLTKVDELNPDERAKVLAAATGEAAKHTAALAEVQLTSALSGEGIAQLRVRLAALI
jgi:GTP-binding protein